MFAPIFVLFLISSSVLKLARSHRLQLSECGESFACWSFPPDCTQENCDGIVQWRREGDILKLRWQTNDFGENGKGRYVAVGLSTDELMGSDTIFDCEIYDDRQGVVGVSVNDRTSNSRLPEASAKLLSGSEIRKEDGLLTCKTNIMLDKIASLRASERNQILNIGNRRLHMLFAKGFMDEKSNEKLIHSMKSGKLFPWSTLEKIRICDSCTDSRVIVREMEQYT
ncbi:hypothetical protein AB6A40_005524 [Gnathostoma spinigerum]|uniref:DOMON domain-containing protein n=1 Tax=Gnathostoma spinigerum TaxID=75299 RepID=A0ABD6EFP2_9BILA